MRILLPILFLLPALVHAQTIGVKSSLKLVDGKNGFEAINNSNLLGRSHCNLGDVDGDGNNDLGVITNGSTGAPFIYVIFLNGNGTIREQSIIEPGKGNFVGDINSSLSYVEVICSMGDINGDKIPDLAVSFYSQQEIYLIFLKSDGSVKSFTRLVDGKNGLDLNLHKDSNFGISIYGGNDLNKDEINDLVIGDSESSYGHGSIYILYLTKEGKVSQQLRIQKDAQWGYNESGYTDRFGNSITSIKDINGDSIDELIVGGRGDSHLDAAPVPKNGSLYCLFLKDDQVDSVIRLRSYDFGYNDSLSNYSSFAQSVANTGDLDGNNYDDLIVGITNDSACGKPVGSAVVLYMKEGFKVDMFQTLTCWTKGMEFEPTSSGNYYFGSSVAGLGDINGDGMLDVSVGALADAEVRKNAGALFLIQLIGKKYVSSTTLNTHEPSIYPNPTSNTFQIKTKEQTEIKVLNTCGQVVWQSKAKGQQTIDVSLWKTGMYLIRFEQMDGTQYVEKLIVN